MYMTILKSVGVDLYLAPEQSQVGEVTSRLSSASNTSYVVQ